MYYSSRLIIIVARLQQFTEEKVVSVEISSACEKYARENVKRNKLSNVEIIQGDVRKKIPAEKFDRIIMARPNLKDSFLDVAFKKIKPKGIIHYYGFYDENDTHKIRELINQEAKNAGMQTTAMDVNLTIELRIWSKSITQSDKLCQEVMHLLANAQFLMDGSVDNNLHDFNINSAVRVDEPGKEGIKSRIIQLNYKFFNIT